MWNDDYFTVFGLVSVDVKDKVCGRKTGLLQRMCNSFRLNIRQLGCCCTGGRYFLKSLGSVAKFTIFAFQFHYSRADTDVHNCYFIGGGRINLGAVI